MNKLNPHITQDMVEYLLANGFESFNDTLFQDGEYKIIISGNKMDFFLWHEGEDGQRSAGFFLIHSFVGLDQLNLEKFGLLLHVCGVVDLKDSLQRYMEINKQHLKAAFQPAEEKILINS